MLGRINLTVVVCRSVKFLVVFDAVVVVNLAFLH
jgi:hypothetical protein